MTRPRTSRPICGDIFLRNKEIIDMKLKNVAVAVVALALAAGMTVLRRFCFFHRCFFYL